VICIHLMYFIVFFGIFVIQLHPLFHVCRWVGVDPVADDRISLLLVFDAFLFHFFKCYWAQEVFFFC